MKDLAKTNEEAIKAREYSETARMVTKYLSLQDKQEANVEVQVVPGDEVMSQYEAIQKKYGEGLSTGYDELDNYFKFLPQQLYLLSAQTHVGKTTLALNMAGRIASTGNKVLFCSLEQDLYVAPLVKKIMGNYPDTLDILKTAGMVDVKTLGDRIALLPTLPKLVIIDHLHFLKMKTGNVTADIDEIIKQLQNMAKGLQIPVLVICHMKKVYDHRAPTMNDLRDSSQLSQVPSVVLLLHREPNKFEDIRKYGSYLSRTGALFVAKNRIQGKTGMESFVLKESGEFVFSKVTNRPSDIPALVTYKDD